MPRPSIITKDLDLVVIRRPRSRKEARTTKLKVPASVNRTRLSEALKKLGITTKPMGGEGGAPAHAVLSAQQMYVEGKGEMRAFSAAVVHPGDNYIEFNPEQIESSLLVWFYGLKKKTDYFIQIKVETVPLFDFEKDNSTPAPLYHVSAGGQDMSFQANPKEQTIPVVLQEVSNEYVGIFVRATNVHLWRVFEVSAQEMTL